ncbi:MAG: aminomethyl transferase family protein [Dehalococcoidia bacterium]|nr:MAG: aminomethyl transferase family protein [Dehalococcoidia bacterium]
MKLLSPLHAKHLEYGAKLIDVLGWQLPEVYTSVEEEHRLVRERAGFTDYAYQGEVGVIGSDAFRLLQKVLVNDLRKISPGKVMYSSLLDETAKMVDDVIVFWVEKDFFILNCALTQEETIKWLKKNGQGLNVSVLEVGICGVALQGPKSREILQKAMNVKDMPYFSLKCDKLGDIPVLIARVSFSGELGYELYIYPEYAHELWDLLMELGKEYDIRPYGLGAQEIHAIEKGYLDLSDFYEGATPLELGLGWTIGFDKDDFIGKEALLKRKSEGLKTKLMGFEVSDPGVVASADDKLIKDGQEIGRVTFSGTYGLSIQKSVGRGWVGIQYANKGEELELEHEGKRTKIKLAGYKWYDPEDKRIKD